MPAISAACQHRSPDAFRHVFRLVRSASRMRVPVNAAILLLVFASSCSTGGDAARRPDSTADALSGAADSARQSGRLASDGTLSIHAAPALHEALRAVADSFASREAVQVRFVVLPESVSAVVDSTAPSADVIVVTGDAIRRLAMDSSWWTLPFAEVLPDSASIAESDSVMRADSAARARQSVSRRARRSSGRRADSIRADSARRAAARADSIRARRAHADSARTLVLTVPADARNAAAAERFVRYLLTDGRAALLRSGLHVLPRLIVHGQGVPPGIRSMADSIAVKDTVLNAAPTPPR